MHPFAAEESDSLHLATVILPQGVYDGQVGHRWHMSFQCGFTLPWGFHGRATNASCAPTSKPHST